MIITNNKLFRLVNMVLVVYWLLGNSVYAEEQLYYISGTVLEKGTRNPLVDANVYVIEQDELNAVTDKRGEFQLALPGPGVYPLQAVAYGFDKSIPIVVRITETDTTRKNLKIYIVPSVTLPKIVVLAERNEDRVGKSVISAEELEQVAGSGGDPLRALQALPGVAATNDGSAEPAIRGSRPGDNAYYMNDLPLSYVYHAGGWTSVLPVSIVSDFNLYAAAFGPQYDDVLGGVIDIGLRDPRTDRIGGLVNINIYSSEFLVEGPVTDKQSFIVGGRRSYVDLFMKTFEDDEEDISITIPSYSDYFANYLWEINDKNRIAFYVNGANDRFEFRIGEESDFASQDPVLVGNGNINGAFDGQNIVWDRRISKSMNNKLIFGHLKDKFDLVIGSAFDNAVTYDRFYIREMLHTNPAPKHKVLWGADVTSGTFDLDLDSYDINCNEDTQVCDPISSGERTHFKDSIKFTTMALYAKDRWRFMPAYTLVLGLRFSTDNYLDEQYLEPRLGFEWQANHKTLLTAGWGMYHQFPDGGQVIEIKGNPNLNHRRAQHSVLGASYKFNKDWFVKSEIYYKKFDDLVVGVDDDRNYINDATGQAYGLELFIKKNRTGKFWGWWSLTLSRSERTDDNGKTFVFNYDQPIISTFVTNYEFARYWAFGAKWKLNSGNPYTPINGSVFIEDPDGPDYYLPIYGEKNSARQQFYHRLDLRVDRDWVYDTWTLKTYFELLNAYGSCNAQSINYSEDYSEKENVCGFFRMFPSIGIQAEF